jgi:hypothetical protein
LGYGPVIEKIRDAVELRSVNQIAIIGYSHGGGSVMDLSLALSARREEIGEFTIPFTAYIDAVLSGTPGAEHRRPLESLFHLNIYHISILDFQGSEIPDSPDKPTENLNVTNTDWGVDLDHSSIDDYDSVKSTVINRIREKVRW